MTRAHTQDMIARAIAQNYGGFPPCDVGDVAELADRALFGRDTVSDEHARAIAAAILHSAANGDLDVPADLEDDVRDRLEHFAGLF